MIETNVRGLIRMTRLCLPHIRDGGHIVNMDSIAGKQAYENAAVYCAVKAAVSMFSAALREDLLGRPIRVTDLAPGLAGGTEFSLVRFKGDEEKAAAVVQGRRAAHRRGHRRLRALRPDATAARQHRRDRRQGAGPVERRADPSGSVMSVMALTILEGSTFCICDELGDITEKTGGFFAEDTRYLSLFRLTVNGETPLLLSSGKVEHFSAAFYLRNPLADGLPQDSVAIVRERFVSDAMQERITVENVTGRAGLVRARASRWRTTSRTSSRSRSTTSRSATRRAPGRSPTPADTRLEGDRLVLDDREEGGARTQVAFSELGTVDGGTVRYRIDLAPRGRWELTTDVLPSANGRVPTLPAGEQFEVPRAADDPGSAEALVRALGFRSRRAAHARRERRDRAAARGRDAVVHDRLRPRHADHLVPDAPPRPGPRARRARRARRAPGDRGRPVDRRRAGEDRPRGAPRQGCEGLVPAVLRDGRRDAALPRAALGGLALDRATMRSSTACASRRCGRSAGSTRSTGSSRYKRRTERGLENQSWKDSGDSQRFADGRIALPPIAPVEVQGYAYDAKRRTAELAREVWGDAGLAERLERDAADLQRRFDEAYWTGEHYALALDRDGAQVDSLCSNVGHLLWSGIVPDERVDAVVAALMGDALWSGWGIRTMSARDAAYNPLAYHNGTVWPHDNSLIAAGLARYGRWEEAWQVVRAMLGASALLDHELPEVFAGLPRGQTPFPIAYPTAARPQAWAAGTPILLLQVLLGLRPEGGRLDDGRAGGSVLGGRHSPGGRAGLRPGVERPPRESPGERRVRVAVISPVWFPVPPTGYGGIEWVVWLLADGLVDAGHEVTLFASGDSHTKATALVGVPGRAERADRPDASRAPALPRRLCARGRVRRDQRPLRPAGGGDRRPDREARPAHDPRAARRRGRRDLRADRGGRAAHRVHLDLDEPAQAEAALPVGGELPERARLLPVPRACRTAATTCCSSAG